MLDCDEAKLLISMLIDGELSKDEEYKLKQHFKECKECEEEFNCINNIVKNLNELPEIELPEDFHENLMNNIKNTNKVKKINWKFYSAVAAGFIILFVAMDFYSVNKYNNISKEQIPIELELKSKLLENDIENSYDAATPANAPKKANEQIQPYAADVSNEKQMGRSLAIDEMEERKIYNDNMILKRYDIYLEIEDYNKALEQIKNFSYYTITEVKNDMESVSGQIYEDDYDKFISELKKVGNINKSDITEEDKNEIFNENRNKINILFDEIEKLNKDYENNTNENIDKLNEEIIKYETENYDIEFNANNPKVNINLVKK